MTGALACDTHRRKPAVSTCVSCDRAVCHDCLVQTRVGHKCIRCTGGSAATAARPGSAARAGGDSTLRRAVLIGGVLLVLVIALAYWLTSGTDLETAEDPRTRSLDGEAAAATVDSRRIEFPGAGDVTLRGTLDLPAGQRQQLPAVAVVGGFGASDRDGVTIGTTFDPLYRDLGEALAAEGIAVLRYDKRPAGTGAGAATLETHTQDAAAALAFLRDRPDVDPSRVGVVGHDQGGLVGLLLASQPDPPAAIVLISTPGRPLAEVVAAEIRSGDFAGDDRDAVAAEFEAAVDELLATGAVPTVSEPLRPVLPADQPAYLASIFGLDPAAAAGAVTGPVLIVRGEADPGIQAADVQALQSGLRGAASVDRLSFEGAGHTLALAGDDAADGQPEASPTGAVDGHMHPGGGGTARAPEALQDIAVWLREHLPATG